MTPTPITIKKSKGARDFFLKLASPLNYKPQQLEIDQTPITPFLKYSEPQPYQISNHHQLQLNTI